MYSSFYPIGTSGHRASASVGFAPFSNYAQTYAHPGYPLPPAPQYVQPQMYREPYPELPGPAHGAGGISAVLEYEPASMAAFMCWCSFSMLGQNRQPTKELESSVVSILHATRLPKSTILIALEYTNQRYSTHAYTSLSESDIFVRMVVALVLANKFNDDNTFTNKSWCGASGVNIGVLNTLEREWLSEVNWNLSVVRFQGNLETLDECWASWVHKQAQPQLPPYTYSPVSPDVYGAYSSAPSSPLYTSGASSVYGYSSPVSASPVKFSQNWNVPPNPHYGYMPQNGYTPYPQSIWAYPPTGQQPPRMDSAYNGFSNPYYNCLATY
ncbi:hypothetical protein OY671_004766 [Metschnikowia pulcherrima]|nr:hypothetical protein OY671_004766 [Metschnikowia pulcherrima]